MSGFRPEPQRTLLPPQVALQRHGGSRLRHLSEDVPDHQPVPFHTLTRGAVTEDALPPILAEVHAQADGLRRLLLGD